MTLKIQRDSPLCPINELASSPWARGAAPGKELTMIHGDIHRQRFVHRPTDGRMSPSALWGADPLRSAGTGVPRSRAPRAIRAAVVAFGVWSALFVVVLSTVLVCQWDTRSHVERITQARRR